MTLADVYTKIQPYITSDTFWLAMFVLSMFVEVSKIKINPWSSILKWVGTRLNSGVSNEIVDLKSEYETNKQIHQQTINNILQQFIDLENTIDARLDSLENKLDNHVAESMRRDILDFQNACINHRKHTKEEFTYIYKLCDKYERYIRDNQLLNSEAEEAIEYIRQVYQTQLQSGAFIISGQLKDEDK